MGTVKEIKPVELRVYDDPKDPNSPYTLFSLVSVLESVYDSDTGKTLRQILDELAAKQNKAIYGVCSADAPAAEKTVDITGFTPADGARATVKFLNGSSGETPTLNISDTGAKPMLYHGSAISDSSVILKAGGVYDFIYDGTSDVYEIAGNLTTGYGY